MNISTAMTAQTPSSNPIPRDILALQSTPVATLAYKPLGEAAQHDHSHFINLLPAGLNPNPLNGFTAVGHSFDQAVTATSGFTARGEQGAEILLGSDHTYYAVASGGLTPFVWGAHDIRVLRHNAALVAVVQGARLADLRAVNVTAVPTDLMNQIPSDATGDFAVVTGPPTSPA